MASLTITFEGREIGHRNFAAGPLTIGSGQACDIILAGDEVGGQHCRVDTQETHFYVTNLGGDTFTEVNGEPVNQSIIYTGDVVTVGNYKLIFVAVGKHMGVPMPDGGILDLNKTLGPEMRRGTSGDPAQEWNINIKGKKTDQTFPIEKPEYVIGTDSSCDIVLSGWGISDNHALLIQGSSQPRLVNLSGKKLILNSSPAEVKSPLASGDTFEIGPYTLTVQHR